MPHSLHARRRHHQRTKRRAGVFVGMTSYPAPWWPDLLARAQDIVRKSGIADGFDTDSWLLDFLRTPATALGGRTPMSLMETESGREQVVTLLDTLQVDAGN